MFAAATSPEPLTTAIHLRFPFKAPDRPLLFEQQVI
jgi:hypothetical protein